MRCGSRACPQFLHGFLLVRCTQHSVKQHRVTSGRLGDTIDRHASTSDSLKGMEQDKRMSVLPHFAPHLTFPTLNETDRQKLLQWECPVSHPVQHVCVLCWLNAATFVHGVETKTTLWISLVLDSSHAYSHVAIIESCPGHMLSFMRSSCVFTLSQRSIEHLR